MIKISFIIDSLLLAGAQTHLIRLANTLDQNLFSIEIICLGDMDEEFVNAANKKSIKIHRLTMKSIRNIGFWKGFYKLIILLKSTKPKIVHTYLNTANVFGALAARIVKIPVVITSRRDMGYFRSRRIALLERISNNFADRIMCVSEAVKNKTVIDEECPAKKTEVIYNGIETIFPENGLQDKELNRYRICIIGALNRQIKGYRDFVEAAKLVLKEIPNAEFLIIGDGALKNDLQLSAISYQIQDKVIFLGKRNDIPELLSTMDISVNASYSEGMSNTILESMAAGVPVVATAVDGNLETVVDGQTGFLVAPKNPQAMAQAIIKILRDRALAKKMGENARKLVQEKFSLEQMAKNYEEFYSGLIKAKGISHKKIGYVVSLFPCWSETFILNEIIEVQKKGVAVTIFSIRKDLEEFIQEKAKPYIKLTIYGNLFKCIAYCVLSIASKPLIIISLFGMVIGSKHKNLKELLKYIWCIFLGAYFSHIAISKKLSHIHAHFATYPAFTALVIHKLSSIPFTFTAHAHDIFLDKSLLKEKANQAKAIVTISDYNKQYLSDYCGNGIVSKIYTVHCGVNLSEYSTSLTKGNGPVNTIVSIGRLTPMKGFEYLIKACNQIKSEASFKCHIIGDGPLYKNLHELINNLRLSEYVVIEGTLDNERIQKILSRANIFVLPCVWDEKDGQDGIPVVLMEAMASGVPVISSKISGIPELVKDQETGLLVEPGNVDQLSQGILQLLRDKELQSRFAEAGRKKVEQEFDIVKNVEKLVELLG